MDATQSRPPGQAAKRRRNDDDVKDATATPTTDARANGERVHPDRAMIHRFAEALYAPAADLPGMVAVFWPDPDSDDLPRDIRFFDHHDLDGIADYAAQLAEHHNVYFQPNLIDPAKIDTIRARHGRGDESEVGVVIGFFGDVDAEKPGSKHHYPPRATLDEALAKMPMPPSIIVNSGLPDRGVHPYMLFIEPVVIESEEQRAKMKGLSEGWQRLLRKKIGDYDLDGTADLCRVLRPPGTVNHKYGCLVTTAVFKPNRRYDWMDFEQYIEPEANKAHPLPHVPGSDDRAGKALAAMLRIGTADGNDGSKRLYTSACRAVEWDLSDNEALTTMRAYAAVRPFPRAWTDEQILDRIRAAERIVTRGENRREASPGAKRDEPVHLRRISAVELDGGSYDLEYLVEGALVKGQPCIVAGGRKSLKTSLIIDMGISLCTGGCFLGKMKVNRPCRVGILSGESGMATIQETARRVCSAAGWRLSDIIDGLVFSPDIPTFEDARYLDALRDFIAKDHLEVVFIDPAFMAMSGADAGNLFIQGQTLRLVNQVCDELGTTFCLVHHTRKPPRDAPFGPVELDHIAWSGFPEWARQWLLIGRREPYAVGSGLHKLWLTTGGSAGHNHLWAVDIDEGPFVPGCPRKWEVTVTSPDEARVSGEAEREAVKDKAREERAQARIEADRQKIVKAMMSFPEGETPKIIRDRAGLGNDRFRTAVASLLESGEIVEVKVSKENRQTPYDGYRLADTETT